MSMKIGNPEPSSATHYRGSKVVACCDRHLTDIFLTEQPGGVTCSRCIKRMIRTAVLPLRPESDFISKGAYIDYLMSLVNKGGVTRHGLQYRLRKGTPPLEAVVMRSDSKPKRSHYYKSESFIKEATRKVMKLNQRK